jgi:DNA-binding response OmpR family regulator
MNALWIDPSPATFESLKPRLPEQVEMSRMPRFSKSDLDGHPWATLDLLILSMDLPNEDVLDWVPFIRSKNPELPILIVCKEASKQQCLRAIHLEINGLFESPLDESRFLELILRHSTRYSELRLDQNRKSVFSQNRWIDLTQTEYKILETLKLAKKRLTRAELQKAVWANASISENNLDTHLTNLKRKIPELNHSLSVKRGLGYFLSLKGK